ncbi:MAG: cobalt-precorrin 5A hydrolase [Lachnospiraceae bacterium]|nr:cobalt-precorrin 5A hydrolase [Lachnospiraceae bacterium]
MKISVIGFTGKGLLLAKRLQKCRNITIYEKCFHGTQTEKKGCILVADSLSDWTSEQFRSVEGIIFIGACGIAVRAISPFVQDKLQDPAVLVIDEDGKFVIPILSGHVGGANQLAQEIADELGATAVITTATDMRHKFAVDVFARQNHLTIIPRTGIAKISSSILAGEQVELTIHSEAGFIIGELPTELKQQSYENIRENQKTRIIISPWEQDLKQADIILCPKCLILGIGCRYGVPGEEIRNLVEAHLTELGIHPAAISGIASIDRKAREAGILELAEKLKVPFQTFTAAELDAVEGKFAESAFVKEQVGVGNVCERAALAACGGDGILLAGKYAARGITIAVAEKKWSVKFNEA